MKDIINWMKANAKEGANLAEFEELVSRASIPETQAEALEFIKRTPALRSALDAEKNREYDRAIEKFRAEKLPDIEKELKDKVYKELHPEETAEMRRIRELEEKLGAKEKAEAINLRKSALMEKAKEFEIDPMIAADYAAFGDEAENVMKKHAEWIKGRLEGVKSETVKGVYAGAPPKGGAVPVSGVKDMTPDQAMEYAKRGPAELAAVMAHLKAKR